MKGSGPIRLLLWLAGPLALLAWVSPALAEPAAPLRPVQVIPLPGVAKRIDHMAVDVRGQRLFVAALGNGTLEAIDLAAGKQVKSVPGLKEPQGVAYLPELGRVVVATAGGTVLAFDGTTFQPVVTLPGFDDADNVRVDATANQVYVGYGAGALAAFEPKSMRKLAEIKLPAHPESFRLEATGPLIFVNLPHAKQIAIVDRQQGRIVSSVPLRSFLANYPMSLDEAHHRFFVGSRHPARLVTLDWKGKVLSDVPCVGDTDDLFYDGQRSRVYVTGGEGFLDVFDAPEKGTPTRLARLPTADGARTSLWVPELRRLFVAAPRRGGRDAAIHVFEAPAQ
jgi:hypothetical protein